jgi:hypothetical protein
MPAGTSLKHISRLKKNNNWKMFSDFFISNPRFARQGFWSTKFSTIDKKVGHHWSSG